MMIRKTVFAASVTALALSATACNTVKGFGRDVESVGQKGEEIITYAPEETEERDAR